MKYREFETKWKTEKDTMIDCRIVNVNGEPNIKCPGYIHRANLGDLMEEYIKHLTISRWKRGFDWRLVERKMKEVLNQVCFEWRQIK